MSRLPGGRGSCGPRADVTSSAPWQDVSADLLGPLPTGDDIYGARGKERLVIAPHGESLASRIDEERSCFFSADSWRLQS